MARFNSRPPPPLNEPLESPTACKICGAPAHLFDVVDFNKHCSEDPYTFGLAGVPVYYHRCSSCGLIYTMFFDKWSNDDFVRFVYNDEYVKVDGDYVERRPTEMAEKLAPHFLGQQKLAILDYGAGNGRLAERLREHGVSDVESYDPFSSPAKPSRKFDVITCIEVIEHSPLPLATVMEMKSYLKDDGVIVLGTGLQPENIARTKASWWYIAPRNGHVTIFNEMSLARLAERCEMIFRPGGGLHCLCGPNKNQKLNLAALGVGRPIHFHLLYAPDQPTSDSSSDRWHGIERGDGGEYRWTSAREISWPIPLVGGSRIRIEIPFLMEIEPRFAETSVIIIGEQVIPARVIPGGGGSRRLLADADIDDVPVAALVLQTPEPKRPSDLSGSPDRRRLGIAVPIAPAW